MTRFLKIFVLAILAAGLLSGQSQVSTSSPQKKPAKKTATTKKTSKTSTAKKSSTVSRPAAQPAPLPQPAQSARPLPLPQPAVGAADTSVKKEEIPLRGFRRETGGLLHKVDTTTLKKEVQEDFHGCHRRSH
jgi:hypothetical protein